MLSTNDLKTYTFPEDMTSKERLEFLRSQDLYFVYRDFSWSLEDSSEGSLDSSEESSEGDNVAKIFTLEIHFEQEGLGTYAAKSQIRLPASFDNSEVSKQLRRRKGNSKTLKETLARNEEFSIADQIDYLVFLLGMAELPSYWKAYASENVKIEAGPLTKDEERWWLHLYWNGLGEYLYLNELPLTPATLMALETWQTKEKISSRIKQQRTHETDLILIPIGGGKDSIVTLERLADEGKKRHAFCINPNQASVDAMRIAQIPEDQRWIWKRRIDKRLLEANARGFLNGHTPFSSVLAFYAYLTAYLGGHRWITISNEASANEATIPGTKINHQYSKSAEFELAFQDYSQSFPYGKSITYFSLLRPFTELKIAHDFAYFPDYFPYFRSCNLGSRGGANLWCGKCPKCLFVYILLSPWLKPSVLSSIFGRDLWDSPELIKTFDELTGFSPNKPFECVGTPEETRLALILCIHTHYQDTDTANLPPLLKRFMEQVEAGTWQDIELDESAGNSAGKRQFIYHGPDLLNKRYPHHVPERFLAAIKKDRDHRSVQDMLQI